jgi:hypothetical protein
MKKVFLGLLFLFATIFALNTVTVQAEDIIELYPYDQEACLDATSECTRTKIGDDHWDVTFNGYNYNVPRGGAQYVSEFIDEDSDGFIQSDEMTGTVWGSLGGIYINNTTSEAELVPTNPNRSDFSTNWRGVWVYFDENNEMVMFEAFVTFTFDIYNDGDATTPNWRLATEAEVTALTDAATALSDAETAEAALIATGTATQAELDAAALAVTNAQTAFDALDAVTIEDALIRMKADSTDTDGYVLEQIGFLKWEEVSYTAAVTALASAEAAEAALIATGTATQAELDAAAQDVTDAQAVLDATNPSRIMAGDPANVVIPAGWTVVSFGTVERSSSPTIAEFIKTLPAALAAGDTAAATITYDHQPAWFTGLAALDDDAVTEGVNVVVDYNGTFTMPDTISAQWVNMFDSSDVIINSEDKLDYTVEISDDSGLLETITYTWNATTEEFDMNAEQTVVDTSIFGKGYTATYKATTPEGDVTEEIIDIVIGVMPPRFEGIEDRFIDENTFIDLLEGITADDGYGNDLTDDIIVTPPTGFNFYNPTPGTYEIDLEFTHHVHFDGVDAAFTVGGTEYTIGEINSADGYSYNDILIWTDLTNFRNIVTEYAMFYYVVGSDGTVIGEYDRYNWQYVTADGISMQYDSDAQGFQDDLVLEDGGFVVVVGRGNVDKTALRDLAIGTSMTLTLPTEDFDYDIVTEDSYTLTVDDVTPPQALLVNDDYMIVAGEYTSVDEAILANVVGYDSYDSQDDLAIYVSDNGGLLVDTVGTYTVEVTVEDLAGNTAEVEFDVEVVAAPVIITQAEVQALIDAAVADALTETEIQALIDAAVADALTETEIQALIDAAVADALTEADVQTIVDDAIAEQLATGCGSAIGIGSAFVGIFAAMGGAGFFFLRKKK